MKFQLILAFLLTSFCINAQNTNQALFDFIESADTVILLIHEDLKLKIEKPGSTAFIQRNLLNGENINYHIVMEKVVLNEKQLAKLLNIVSNQKQDDEDVGRYCFDSHHSIFIKKNKHWSYIDLSFRCDRYIFSKDLTLNKKTFLASYDDWRVMKDFFQELNLIYKLPD